MKRTITLFLALVLILSSIGTTFAADIQEEEVMAVLSTAAERGNVTSTEEDTMVPRLTKEDLLQWDDAECFQAAAFTAEQPAYELQTIKIPYADVPEDSWYHDNVAFVYQMGLMNGVDKTHFNPTASLTRAELVTILYRLEKLYCSNHNKPMPACADQNKFEDVPSGSFYDAAVTWASANGIVKGVDSTTFNPTGLVTREQIATIFYRYYTFQGREAQTSGSLNSFSDGRQVSGYAKSALEWAVGCGLIAGNEDKTIRPQNSASRAEAAVLMERMNLLLECDRIPHTSQKLFNLIMAREGFSATPYWDVSQYSIGYGSYCGKTKDDVPARYWDGITEAEALVLLKTYMAEIYEPSVISYEKKHNLHFTQNQFDALADFTYALGALWTSGGYKLNNVLEHGGTDLEIVDAFGCWCRVSGSVNLGTAQRRLLEANIFLFGDYTGTGNHTQYCAIRYTGNGSKLTSKYTDDVGFYVVGKPYTNLPSPEYVPTSGTETKTFAGWKDNATGKMVTNSTAPTANTTLSAQWK